MNTQETKVLPKIAIVKSELKDAVWNKHLPIPLVAGEKVIVSDDQSKVEKGYVRVKHGTHGAKGVSIFSKHHFLTLTGKEFYKC